MAAELRFRPALKKLGLEPHEFEKLLEDKMSKLLEEGKVSETAHVTQSKKAVKQYFSIRANISNPNELDGRRSSSKGQQSEGIPSDPKSSPLAQAEIKVEEGDSSYTEKVNYGYQKSQCELFDQFEDCKYDEDGYMMKASGDKFNTSEMCNKIDSETLTLIGELNAVEQNAGASSIRRNRESKRKMFDPCRAILVGRIKLDWAVKNDIMDEDGKKQWNEHVSVIISFAALAVVIDALTRLSHYGLNSFVDELNR